MPRSAIEAARIERARLAVGGLSVGDAFGQCFFASPDVIWPLIRQQVAPKAPWFYTDDTVMALGIVEVLAQYGQIEQDALAQVFARTYRRQPDRGYGGTAHRILRHIGQGIPWQVAAGEVFSGMGSFGNGAAMRAAPIGAYFADELPTVVEQARLSAAVTHAHPDGQAGAIAVAVAAAWAYEASQTKQQPRSGQDLLQTAYQYTPESDTRSKLNKALHLPFSYSIRTAVSALGNGSNLSAADTVPFALWCAARHLDDYAQALWATVSGLGDRDTTCAIVGGIVALANGIDAIPEAWLTARENISWSLYAKSKKCSTPNPILMAKKDDERR